MSKLKIFRNIIIIIILSSISATILMIAIQLLPTKHMSGHVAESVDALSSEGLYPNWAGGDTYATGDNFTDSIMLRICIYDGDESIVQKALLNTSWWVDVPGLDYIQILAFSFDDSLPRSTSIYPRYWHGYEIILKPLLLFFNVHEIRILNMFFQLLFLSLCIMLIAEKLGKKYVPILLITLLGINPITCAISFQFSCIYYITLLTIIYLLWKRDSICENNGYIYLFLMDGILCAFFDFLTYPLVALAIPLIFFIIADNKNRFIKNVIIPPIAWAFGYGFQWASKWIISYILTGYNTIKDAVDQAKYRTNGNMGIPESHGRLSAIESNFNIFSKSPQLIIFLLIAFIYIIIIIKKAILDKGFKLSKTTLLKIIPLIVVILYPFVWYIVMFNHSYIHIFIAYRNVSIFAAGIIATLIVLL
ncbi:MAG: hypothetical protein J6P57_03575 [Lachnospiraceae bacterium]|nr:hypothetical protein [Lachnospiraceae bacterium]